MGEQRRIRAGRLGTGSRPGRILLVAACLMLSACASQSPAPVDPLYEKDPFDRFNTMSFNTQQRLDRVFLRPFARAYDWLPDKLTRRVSNFINNWLGPVDISNNLLQGEFKRGFSGVGRLLFNSTIGLGGLFDPASKIGMPRYPEDFGQTLAVWGVPSGPYIYLPIFGPRTARDLAGVFVDWQYNPVTQYDDTSTRNSLVVLDQIVKRAEFLGDAAEGALERSDDKYGFVQSNYAQARDALIFNGDEPDETADFEE